MNVIHLPQEQKEKQKAVVLVEEEKKSEFYIDKKKVFQNWEKTEYRGQEYYQIQNIFIKKAGFIFKLPFILVILLLLTIETIYPVDGNRRFYYDYIVGFYITYKFITDYFSFRKELKEQK